MTDFITIFTVYWWSGTKPAISLSYACTRDSFMIKYNMKLKWDFFRLSQFWLRTSKVRQYRCQNYSHILRQGPGVAYVWHAKRQKISSISISSFIVSQPYKEEKIHGEGQKWFGRRISLELSVCCVCLSYFLVRMMETLSPHLKSREEQQSKSFKYFLWNLEDSRSVIWNKFLKKLWQEAG